MDKPRYLLFYKHGQFDCWTMHATAFGSIDYAKDYHCKHSDSPYYHIIEMQNLGNMLEMLSKIKVW